ncbi:MAG: DNA helicase RecQ [Clostridia bacterium]|nr:DNA helicase RecQ [Clostridia bacterium]
MSKYTVLRDYFGYTAFREGQEKLIDGILGYSDVLGIMPTGGGKSICYQVPAMLLPGITLVISPLISLMKDQVMGLKTAGIPAAYLNSSLSAAQQHRVCQNILAGAYKIVYVAPERLENFEFLNVCREVTVSLVAVDEAHCISQWGQDFRPGYLKIADFLEELPRRPVVAAFTATATDVVRQDIVRLLRLWEPLQVITGFDRPNLRYEVRIPKSKMPELISILSTRKNKSGIIYCMTRGNVEKVCEKLQAEGFPATRYHAGLSDEERRENQEDFLYDRSPIMVATNAFGMGIDKSNVAYVIHYNMPLSVEAYYQEAGRAGRDGSPADCILLYAPSDLYKAKDLLSHPSENHLLSEAEQEENLRRNYRRLDEMLDYCRTTDCLRGYILDYFGQPHAERCDHCGNCETNYTSTDITVEAKKILSCVKRAEDHLGYPVGKALIGRILLGSRDKRIIETGLDKLTTYSLLQDQSRARVSEMIDYLEMLGAISVDGNHGGATLTPIAREILFGEQKVIATFKPLPEKGKKKKQSAESKESAGASDEALYELLRNLRMQLAKEEGVPAYVIFSNQTLSDMAAKKPRSLLEFLDVSGVGQIKAQKYSEAFLEVIEAYLNSVE